MCPDTAVQLPRRYGAEVRRCMCTVTAVQVPYRFCQEALTLQRRFPDTTTPVP